MAAVGGNVDIRLSKSCLSEAEKNAVLRVMEHEYLGMGAEVKTFENNLSEFFGRPVVCVANGTAALQLALQAVGLKQGDEVLVQSLTYVASFQAISATGATPVSCDIDPETLCLDLRDAEKKLTPNTKAVMPVHYAGGVGALDELYLFAERHDLRVVEDAAHAFGTCYNGRRVGSFGDVICFSFDGIKNITSGEGGCVVSSDETVVSRIQDARLLGVEKDTENRYAGARSWEFAVSRQGWRYHMSNLMAAIGIEQLSRFPKFAAKRQTLAKTYDLLTSEIPWIETLVNDYSEVVPHIYPIILREDVDRDQIQAQLMDRGIGTGIHYYPNHKHLFFKTDEDELPVTDALYPRLLTLPLHPDLENEDIYRVIDSLKRCKHVS